MNEPGTLYIVATPIGNLEDITLRAIRILSEADVILAEDTRVTLKLLDHFSSNIQSTIYNIHSKPKVLSYHQHSSDVKKLEIMTMLMDGKNIALVTDAGTPGISDPGNELITYLLSLISDLKVVPIPGSSAITAALSVSGLDVSKFVFLGFFPKKKAQKLIKTLTNLQLPFVYYDSPFRVVKNLEKIREHFPNVQVVVARELTKLHETLYRGTIEEVINRLVKEGRVKGEVVVIINLASKGEAFQG